MLSELLGQYAPFFIGYQRALNELGCGIRQSGSSLYALGNAMSEYARLRESPIRESVSGGRNQFLGGYEYALRIFGEGAENLSGSDEALSFAMWAYNRFLEDPTAIDCLPKTGS